MEIEIVLAVPGYLHPYQAVPESLGPFDKGKGDLVLRFAHKNGNTRIGRVDVVEIELLNVLEVDENYPFRFIFHEIMITVFRELLKKE